METDIKALKKMCFECFCWYVGSGLREQIRHSHFEAQAMFLQGRGHLFQLYRLHWIPRGEKEGRLSGLRKGIKNTINHCEELCSLMCRRIMGGGVLFKNGYFFFFGACL